MAEACLLYSEKYSTPKEVIVMSKRRITIYFTSDEEAGAVYGLLRMLKRNGFFQSFNVFDQEAEILVDEDDTEIVLAHISNLRTGGLTSFRGKARRGYPGISFTET